MLEARPGAFVRSATATPPACIIPAYDFNDAALPFGIAYFARIV